MLMFLSFIDPSVFGQDKYVYHAMALILLLNMIKSNWNINWLQPNQLELEIFLVLYFHCLSGLYYPVFLTE